MAEDDKHWSSAPASRLRWDVFLSFRGKTRDMFIRLLYEELNRNDVRVFPDIDGLRQDDSLDPTLFEAIEDCAVSIVVISPKYASSRFCVEELATIFDCSRLVLPVFYLVDPSDVRRQKAPFEEDFRKLENDYEEKCVTRWRKAMKKVGGISGWVFGNRKNEEQDLVQILVKRVLAELDKTPESLPPYTVGLKSRVDELTTYLDLKSKGIIVLGLVGMGGVGKTTLAKSLLNKLVPHFESCSFIPNIREAYKKQNGLLSIQNKLIHDLSTGEVSHISNVNSSRETLRRILQKKQVLIAFDDIDDETQLETLITSYREWFHKRTRIIVSTRDKEVLSKIDDFMIKTFEVKELSYSDSLKLFCYHSMRREKPPKAFEDLSKQIVDITGHLPLALEVFGSSLFDKWKVEQWKDVLQKMKQIRPQNLQDVLKISFELLDEQEKCVFLDIACLFIDLEMKRGDVVDISKGCGFSGEKCMAVLVARCLVKVHWGGRLWMHDQIRDMGRQIVLSENIVDAGSRSRLWDRREILRVLQAGTGTRSIQGMILDFGGENFRKGVKATTIAWLNLVSTPSFSSALTYLKEMYKEYTQQSSSEEEEEGERGQQVKLCAEPFKAMVKLRLLQFSNLKLEGNFTHLPAELKWLQLKSCSLNHLPSNFCPRELTVLDLSESTIQILWAPNWWPWQNNKLPRKLMVLNLYGCHSLSDLPNLSENRELEKLILERCISLSRIHSSVGNLLSLRVLNLKGCYNLVEFPKDVSGLKQLETLILSGCNKLCDLPENIDCMVSLRELLLDQTAVEQLPESIFRLAKLEILNIDGCQLLKQLPPCLGKLCGLKELSCNGSALEKIPDSIGSLVNLQNLNLMNCKMIEEVPNSVGNLKSLTNFWLYRSSVKELPDSIGSLFYLKVLSVENCTLLSKLPSSIGGLSSVVQLQLGGTSIEGLPDQIGDLKSLQKLEMRNCLKLVSLPESIGGLLGLETLIIQNAAITELPESLGLLENLVFLMLNRCRKLLRLPDSVGKLKSLHHLLMIGTGITELPKSFGLLSSLLVLEMGKDSNCEATNGAKSPIVLPSSFSKLSRLKEFDARAWKITGKIPDEFEKLTALEILKLGHNDFCGLPSSMRGLSVLTELHLNHCKKIKVVPPLPSSLVKVNAANCIELERFSDLSNLGSLEELQLTNCEKLREIPGLECLKSLTRLHMSGCSLCSSEINKKLDKAALRNMKNMSMPGSEIPDWFTQGGVSFSKIKNRSIKAVIIAVVLCIDHRISEHSRDSLMVVDVQAMILRLGMDVFKHTMCLAGFPRSNEDQLYLCRYQEYCPLVSLLMDGDRIEVAMRDLPYVQGVELKKSGIHLVYENEDDYDGDEEYLHQSQRSVSEKLKKFIVNSE